MNREIQKRIIQLNPWLSDPSRFAEELARRIPDPYVPRTTQLSSVAEPGNARLVVGPRQAGKSTLVWHEMRDRRPEQVLFLNAEEALVRRSCESAAGFLSDLQDMFPTVDTIILDEAQHLDEAGLFVKGLVDAHRGLDLFVTGSSSFHLGARTRESLAGRAERRRVLPFSLEEVSVFEAPAVSAAREMQSRRYAERMLVWGGYPRVWLGEQPRHVLSNLVEAFVLRDASDRFRIDRPDAFRRLLQLAAGQVGQMVNFAEWASLLGVSAPTVRQYVSILEECWILALLPPFAGGRRQEVTKAQRVHFYDTGLRNALLDALSDDVGRRPDRGSLFESLVFAELVKVAPRNWTLHYWRAKGGAEVDFVLARGGQRIAVEVKAGNRPRLTRASRSFIDAYAPSDFVVVTGISSRGEGLPEEVDQTRIHPVGLVSLAKTIRALTGR